MIYLDHAATTPLSETALKIYGEVATRFWGNTQSLHQAGIDAANLLTQCRKKIADLLNGEETGVIFTSGGTEANHLAIDTLLRSSKSNGRHIISTSIEHPSILNYLKKLKQDGYEITLLPVNSNGLISLSDLEASMTDQTILATIQFVNSEIGTIQNIQQIGSILEKNGILFHSDCVQAFGKILVDITAFHLDSVSLSSHKLYGPKGTGVCYLNPAYHRKPIFEGGIHEMGLRPGTVNLPAIAAFTAASDELVQIQEIEFQRISLLKHHFLSILGSKVTEIGASTVILPHILGLLLPNIEGQSAMLSCSQKGIMLATGSACSQGHQTPSHVIKALGKSDTDARSFIRLSFGKETTYKELEKTALVLKRLIC